MYEAATIELDRPRVTMLDPERARFAEQLLVAVSDGWDQVIRLLESREPDPAVRQRLEALLDA